MADLKGEGHPELNASKDEARRRTGGFTIFHYSDLGANDGAKKKPASMIGGLGALKMVSLVRTKINYSDLRKLCLEEIRHWPGCETVAGLQLVRKNTPSGFLINITLYGQANKRIADRAKAFVERVNQRRYRLSE